MEECPLTEQSSRIRAIAAGQYSLTITKQHAVPRMQERAIDALDIRHVLKTGRTVETSCPGGQWRYTVEGRTTEGKTIRLIVAVDEDRPLINLITVMHKLKEGEWR